MSLSLYGQVTDIQTSDAVENATVTLVDPITDTILHITTTSVGAAVPGGYFTFEVTFQQMLEIMGGNHHRTVTFKVYDGVVFLGCQDKLISALTFRGTETIEVEVDSSYTPPEGNFLYNVAGKVVEVDGTPIAGVDVKVYHKKMATETLLETEQTASDGRFLVRYEGPPGAHPDQASIDIIVRCYDDEELVASSEKITNPRWDLSLILVRDNETLRGKPSIVSYMDALDPLLDGVAYHELDADQVGYLSAKTGFDAGLIATIARAHRLSEALAIDAEAFYGIAHAGFPLSTNAVVSLDAETVTSALMRAIADNAISSSVEADITSITSALAAARLDHAVPASDPQTTTLGSVLTAASLTSGLPRSFAEAYLSHIGTIEEFWEDLRADTENFGDAVVDTIQFTLQVGTLTASHAPLVKLLSQMRVSDDFSVAAELAQYDDQDWIDLLDEEVDSSPVSTPAGIPGADETERRANYGRAISRMVEDLYPSAHVAYHLPGGAATSDVAGFVIQNPGFSFARTSIDDFLETAEGLPPEPEDLDALRQDLLKIQRVFNIAPRFGRTSAVGALLEGGIVSARQIRMMGLASFKAIYASALGGEDVAASIYDKADKVASTTLAAFTQMRKEFVFPSTNVITTPGCGDPDLAAIFGSLDYCACRHCDSVHGAAAYFVEIMNFLRPGGDETVLNKLIARRPELMHVKLNCENADTPLPAIDLVNEVLERAVLQHHSEDPHTNPATWPQTTWSGPDLLAHPEKIYTDVYDTFLSDDEGACFPWILPFDLGLSEARIYLTHLGVSRIALQDAFEWFDGLGEDEIYRIDERLGLSPSQGSIVRRTNEAIDLWHLWGFASAGTWIDQINRVETFLERSELSFEGLQALLRTDLLSDVKIVYDEPCTLKDAELRLIADPEEPGLDTTKLEKLVTVFRVGRALGWSNFEVDMVMRGLGLTFAQPVDEELEVLAHFVRVRRQYPRLPLAEVLSWWAPLDTRAPAEGVFSFYEEVVRPNTREPEFRVGQIDANELKLVDVKGSLLGILQVDEASLGAAMAATGLTDGSSLNRANLSKLYRVASLARATSLRVPDLVTLVNYREALKEGSPGPFDGAPDAPVRDLLAVAADVRTSGLTAAALDFVLRDQASERFGASAADVTRALLDVITAQQASDADHEAHLPPADLPARERLAELLARLYADEELESALGLIDTKIPLDATGPQAVAARDALFGFLTIDGAAYVELGKAFDEAAAPDARAVLAVPELSEHLRRLARDRAAVRTISTSLDLEPADASALLESYVHDPLEELDPSRPALDVLTDDGLVAAFNPIDDAELLKSESFPKVFLEREGLPEPARLYRALTKVALVIRTLRFSPGLLRWLLAVAPEASVEILDLTQLPAAGAADSLVYAAYTGWGWLRRAIDLRDRVLGAPEDLVDLLGLIFAETFVKATTLSSLANSAGWDITMLSTFETHLDLSQEDFQTLEGPLALADALAVSKRVGVDPATLHTWATTVATTAQAAEIKGAAQAKYSPAAWPSVAEPLRDRLREQQRDALAQYLVPRLSGVGDRDDLLAHFLMDPEVSACGKTSRLLFATSAVQLFIQRALMGHEDDVVLSDEHSEEWVWMKRYRVWEANRKIFLYPENWVLPELRDDKSPLFRKLEEEISQADATEESVENAYIRYLEGLHEIARLEICGTYHEVERTSKGEVVVDRLHVFGRTHDDPSKVFYRQRIDDAYWTPWEEVPFQIEARGVLPIMVNRRLMLIWPKFGMRPTDTKKQPNTGTSERFVEISLMWSERQKDGWSGVKTSRDVTLDWSDVISGLGEANSRNIFSKYYLASEIGSGGEIVVRTARLVHETNPPTFYYPRPFIYDSLHDTFILINESIMDQPALNEDGLTGDAPTPYDLTIRHQAFTAKSVPGGLKLPIRNSVDWQLDWSPKIINTPSRVAVTFPRQTRGMDSHQPFTYEDDSVGLYLRRVDPPTAMPTPDIPRNGVDPTTAGDTSFVPYVGLVVGAAESQALTPIPVNQILAGGAAAANAHSWVKGFKANVGPKFRVSALYHPHAAFFIEQVRKYGVDGLLAPVGNDLVFQDLNDHIDQVYVPTPNECVVKPYPTGDIDFLFGGSYSVYNWELFFHAPMYIADRLMAERRFAEAQRWLHYIFNPTRTPSLVAESDCKYYWRIKPFRVAAAHMSIDELLELLHYEGDDAFKIARREDLEAQIDASRTDPFRPHLIARMRPTAYMRAVVMKYLDNLIAWGDDLFRQDTLESNNEALLYYDLALQILGKRPRKLDARERPDRTFFEACAENDGFIDDFSNFMVQLENKVLGVKGGVVKQALVLDFKAQDNQQKVTPGVYQFAYIAPEKSQTLNEQAKKDPPKPPFMSVYPFTAGAPDADPVRSELYFCVPPNGKLLGYWDIVADRFFKLRHCLNLDGVRRELPLYQPPIDPALLAKAAAQGIDIGTAISNLGAPLPHYRFSIHLGIAKEFGSQVSALGGALLQALEKRDAEALALLRAGQELKMMSSVRKIRETALDESTENIAALRAGRHIAEERLKYYQSRERMNALEEAEVKLQRNSLILDAVSLGCTALASILAFLPQIKVGVRGFVPSFDAEIGGQQLSTALHMIGQSTSGGASINRARAGMTLTQASYDRRKEDWDFQARLAQKDIAQIDRQITAAEIRKAISEIELKNHDQQAADAAEVLETMQSKFTNTELYAWMSGELSTLYFQVYQLAVDLARRAERCYRYELAIDDGDVSDFISYGHWDNRRKGLLAGERLAQDLRRMEAAYYEKNRREYELTKRVSLASLDPVALVALRKTGACHFFLPEAIFDLDHPSHYLRRIKMVGVSVPAVTGSFGSVGATLTYESGAIRREPDIELELAMIPSVQSIAVSTGQDDAGLFEPNLRDERYLPFEGKGLVQSSWRLSLPSKVRSFDYETIADVILTIRYTAREGGDAFGSLVQDGLPAALAGMERADGEAVKGTGQVRIFSARAEFPEAWRTFVTAGADEGAAELELDLSEERFPHPQEPVARTIEFAAFFVRWRPGDDTIPTLEAHLVGAELNGPGVTEEGLTFAAYKAGQPASYPEYLWFAATTPLTSEPGTFTLSVTTGWPVGKDPDDILVLIQYRVGAEP
ncbi:MAG: hypothetical protein IPK80_25205 [Nannocystis sp.]|nr:hypothetical protein [Nannocystis sp.]